MGSRSESTNSVARIEDVADKLCALIAEEFDCIRDEISANIRCERQIRWLLGCVIVSLVARWLWLQM